VRFQKENNQKHKNGGELIKIGGVNSNSNLGPTITFWKLGCLRMKQLGSKLLHVLLKNGFRGFRGFRNASVKFPKTLGKHISLNIGEREEKKKI